MRSKFPSNKIGTDDKEKEVEKSNPPISVIIQLCKVHQLSKKVPITSISSLQIMSSDKKERTLICTTSKDSAVNIFRGENLFEMASMDCDSNGFKKNNDNRENERGDIVDNMNNWNLRGKNNFEYVGNGSGNVSGSGSVSSSSKVNGETKELNTISSNTKISFDLISSFQPGLQNNLTTTTAPTTMFSPLVLIPQIISTMAGRISYNTTCRFSADATRVLISTQHGQDCTLYR